VQHLIGRNSANFPGWIQHVANLSKGENSHIRGYFFSLTSSEQRVFSRLTYFTLGSLSRTKSELMGGKQHFASLLVANSEYQ